MSYKFQYKYKLFHKVNQLKKRIRRIDENPGHSEWKRPIYERRIKKLINRIREKKLKKSLTHILFMCYIRL